MKIVLTLFLVGFVVLCGGLVVESGLFETDRAGQPCILLQQTTVGYKPETANPTAEKNAQLKSFESVNLSAVGGPPESILLGAADPETEDADTGFKFQLELSSKGAAISKATFSNGPDNRGRATGFDNRDYKDPQPLVILSPVGDKILSMANSEFIFVQQGLQLRLNELSWRSFEVETEYDGSQSARFEATIKNADTNEPLIKLTKTYKVVPGSYLLDCNLAVENLSGTEQKVRFNLTGPVGTGREGLRADMRKVVGGFITAKGEIVASRQGIITSFFGRFKKKFGLKDATQGYQRALQTRNQASIKEAKERLQIGHNLPDSYKSAHFLWAATTNKYFTTILIPVPDEGRDFCDWVAEKTGRFYNPDGDERGNTGDESVGVNLETTSSTLAEAGQMNSSKAYNFQLYLGPKDKDVFYVNELYKSLGFIHTIDFMPCFCCPANLIRPLAFGILTIMKWMYGLVGNYGVVIIILVLLIRIAMHPITKKSQVSMSKMSKLAPRAEQIKKKYANNKAELNKHLMALYKEQGASPIMGMLPMFVQMPIWIALYSAIYASIALRGAAFLPFWITDLSAPDALVRFSTVTVPLLGWKISSFNLLPILMGVAMYFQQKLMPKQATTASSQVAQQQKMMMIMMPLMFPLLLYNAPSGLNLYIMSSVFAGVVEQHVIRKHIREKEQAESTGLVAATSKTGGKVKKKKPKPFYKM